MHRALYVAAAGYLAISVAALWRPSRPRDGHAAGTPVAAGGGAGWFARIKPYCNPVEIDVRLAYSPPPSGAEGAGFVAACYALAGKIDSARATIERLPQVQRRDAAGIVFTVGHPVADAGDDRAAGPIMELVIEYWPDHYMALYHAGMSEYILGQYERAGVNLRAFLDLYASDDGWRRNAIAVLDRLGG